MSDKEILGCLIAFILGWIISRMIGDGFAVGGEAWTTCQHKEAEKMMTKPGGHHPQEVKLYVDSIGPNCIRPVGGHGGTYHGDKGEGAAGSEPAQHEAVPAAAGGDKIIGYHCDNNPFQGPFCEKILKKDKDAYLKYSGNKKVQYTGDPDGIQNCVSSCENKIDKNGFTQEECYDKAARGHCIEQPMAKGMAKNCAGTCRTWELLSDSEKSSMASSMGKQVEEDNETYQGYIGRLRDGITTGRDYMNWMTGYGGQEQAASKKVSEDLGNVLALNKKCMNKLDLRFSRRDSCKDKRDVSIEQNAIGGQNASFDLNRCVKCVDRNRGPGTNKCRKEVYEEYCTISKEDRLANERNIRQQARLKGVINKLNEG